MTLASIWAGYKLLPVNIFLQHESKKKWNRNTGALNRYVKLLGGRVGGGGGSWFCYEPLQKTEGSEVQAILIYNGN